jgi:hypothetical protein
VRRVYSPLAEHKGVFQFCRLLIFNHFINIAPSLESDMQTQLEFIPKTNIDEIETLKAALRKNLNCLNGLFRRIEELKIETERLRKQIEEK